MTIMNPVSSDTLVCKPVHFDLFRLSLAGDILLSLDLSWPQLVCEPKRFDRLFGYVLATYVYIFGLVNLISAELLDSDVTSFAQGKLYL